MEKIKEYSESDLYESFEMMYFDFSGELETDLEKKSEPKIKIQHPESPKQINNINLPKIDLPRFDSNYASWRSFKDMYMSLIHNDDRLSPAQKLHYLRSSLSGEAERLVKQFEVTDNNYAAAWETLTRRYDNKRVLISSQLKALFDLPVIKIESPKNIKQLLDKTQECLYELKALGISTENWDPIIIVMMVQRMPSETHKQWEHILSKQEDLPTLKQMYEFLETRFRTLEAIADAHPSVHQSHLGPRKSNIYHIRQQECPMCQENHELQACRQYISTSPQKRRKIILKYKHCLYCLKPHAGKCLSTKRCIICRKEHQLFRCNEFQSLTPLQRKEVALKNNRCFNCLNTHALKACPNGRNCYKCGKRHHTTLHDDSRSEASKHIERREQQYVAKSEASQGERNNFNKEEITTCHYNKKHPKALLATALVKVRNSKGHKITFRALIDLGSQSSFITEAVYQELRLKGKSANLRIAGLGSTDLTTAKRQSKLILKSNTDPNFELEISAYINKKITNVTPPKQTSKLNWDHIQGIPLADPRFLEPGNIDILLGVNVYSQIILDGVRRGEQGTPIAQNTKLGWILFGEMSHASNPNISFSALTSVEDSSLEILNQQLKNFWELEELPTLPKLTQEEEQCEQHYRQTHNRLPTGQYQVKLPFTNNIPSLGESKQQAFQRFKQLEKRFNQNEDFHKEYIKVMDEYVELGHMELVKDNSKITSRYYMPHHAVFKESTTTKVRVVFDASAKTSNGKGLNEQMLTGATLQPKLFSTLLRWRKYEYAMTADIEKMYRMIRIHPQDRKYQTILWRNGENKTLREYELTTVTFGTTSAPFLAIRTLQQLAYDEEIRYPRAAKIALRDFYVDDVLTGAHTLNDALILQKELNEMLKTAHFHLRKWAANHNELLTNILPEDREIDFPLRLEEGNQIKALGLYWHPATDFFSYSLKIEDFSKPPNSKRNILSEVAKLYDPLGWIAPCIINAKILIQQLWMLGCPWDEAIPTEISTDWQQFKDQLRHLQGVKIPRWIRISAGNDIRQIHGFSDASNKAYAAVVYLRVIDKNQTIHVNLLTAKTKVAPIKLISLPRLKLCGALLLNKLIKQVRNDMHLNDCPSFSWTDSKIVLAWLKDHPRKWQTFVANRVAEIQDNSPNNIWKYVPTKDNPSDIATRGLQPKDIGSNKTWWNGPEWLRKPEGYWPQDEATDNKTTLEMRKLKTVLLTCDDQDNAFLSKFSSFSTLIKVLAQCLRFINNSKKQNQKRHGQLTAEELRDAQVQIFKMIQIQEYAAEMEVIRNKGQPNKTSPIARLNPFLDRNGLMRVGGRIQNSLLSYDTKHPIIIPKRNHITNIIILRLLPYRDPPWRSTVSVEYDSVKGNLDHKWYEFGKRPHF